VQTSPGWPLISFSALRTGRSLLPFWSLRPWLTLLAFRSRHSGRAGRPLIALRALRTGRTLFALRSLWALTTSSEEYGQRENYNGS